MIPRNLKTDLLCTHNQSIVRLTHTPDKKLVIVQHGMGRNGNEYRDAWVPAANRQGLLFDAAAYTLVQRTLRRFMQRRVQQADCRARSRPIPSVTAFYPKL